MIFSSKKIKELESENEELKTLIQGLNAKEEQLKRFDELIKNARIEYGDIKQRKDQTAQTLEILENEKAKLSSDIKKISNEIKQLSELKISEQNQLLTLRDALLESDNISYNGSVNQLPSTIINLNKEIETAEKRKDKIKEETIELEKKYKDTLQKIQEMSDVERNLLTKIEKRKEELSVLIDSHNTILQERQENLNSRLSKINAEEKKASEESWLRIKKLSYEEANLLDNINEQKQKLEEIEKQIEEKNNYLQDNLKNTQLISIEDENEIISSTGNISQEESAKKELISELDNNISIKKSQLESLTEEFKTKTALMNEISEKNNRLFEEIEFKLNKLSELNESVEKETAKLTDLNYSLETLEDEFKTLSNEVKNTRSIKNEIEKEIKEETNKKKELEEYLKELRETTAILAQFKSDIEQGSGMSAKRFSSVIKYYSSYINEMYKQKTSLEKILNKKEKDINDLDRILEERQSEIYDIDRFITVDQDTAELFQELILKVQKQWEQIKNIISFPTDKSFSNIIQEKDTPAVNDQKVEKLYGFENTLKEIMKKSESYFNKYDETRIVPGNEKEDPAHGLSDLNSKINDAADELINLQISINKIKEEHEEHRKDINNLVSIKNRLEQEISKYEIIKEKILQEQNIIREKRVIKEQKEQLARQEDNIKISNPDKII